MTNIIDTVIGKNGLIFSFLLVGLIMLISFWVSKKIFRNKIPGVAIAIIVALLLALTGDKHGLSDIPLFGGMALLGGSMLRDFTIVSTAFGADINKIKSAGPAGVVSLLAGVLFSFILGVVMAMLFGIKDPVSLVTIGAGACTYIVGPVTGTAVGASSDIIALSITIGVIKSIVTTVFTPMIAKNIGLDNPHSALVFGGMLGTTSGVAAGLAATDPKLVPYGALTATFYTGLGCLLCPSVLYFLVRMVVG